MAPVPANLLPSLAGRAKVAFRLARSRLVRTGRPRVLYVTDGAEWVLDWIGRYLTEALNLRLGVEARMIREPRWEVGQIIHYGSLWPFLDRLGRAVHRRNRIVATIYHGDRSQRFPELERAVDRFLEGWPEADRIVTACRIMEGRLISWGVEPKRISLVPEGVDLSLFRPAPAGEKESLRRGFGVPQGAICLGSFQKDGNGWDDGLTPKLIKGPDILLEVIRRLKDDYPLFILLSGPARGYVKQGLEGMGVPYRHLFLKHYPDLAELYRCLDLYLVTSREEGGPQAVLEALASGVPLVSTRVGLAPDVIEDGVDGLLAQVEDVEALAALAARVIDRPELAARLAAAGLKTIQAYDWPLIAARYFHEVYAPLMEEGARV